MNKGNVNQLFLGTYRLYRTDNAEAPSPATSHWNRSAATSPAAAPGAAPNGARGCLISRGRRRRRRRRRLHRLRRRPRVRQPGRADQSTTRPGPGSRRPLPGRPVNQIAVDRSNWRIAYVAFGGFNAGTPGQPGHVFKTTDGGNTGRDISGNLPDVPGQLARARPVVPEHALRRHRRRRLRHLPTAASLEPARHRDAQGGLWQLDFDPADRLLAAGTHGRAPTRSTTRRWLPRWSCPRPTAARRSGPGSTIDYTITRQEHRQRRRRRA